MRSRPSKKSKERWKKNGKKKKLLPTRRPKTKRSMRLRWRLRGSKKKKKERFRDLGSCRRRQPTGKPRSMLSEQNEHLKRAKDRLGKGRDLSSKRDREFKLTWSWLAKSSLLKSSPVWQSKHALKEKTI